MYAPGFNRLDLGTAGGVAGELGAGDFEAGGADFAGDLRAGDCGPGGLDAGGTDGAGDRGAGDRGAGDLEEAGGDPDIISAIYASVASLLALAGGSGVLALGAGDFGDGAD